MDRCANTNDGWKTEEQIQESVKHTMSFPFLLYNIRQGNLHSTESLLSRMVNIIVDAQFMEGDTLIDGHRIPAEKVAFELYEAQWTHAAYVLEKTGNKAISDTELKAALYRAVCGDFSTVEFAEQLNLQEEELTREQWLDIVKCNIRYTQLIRYIQEGLIPGAENTLSQVVNIIVDAQFMEGDTLIDGHSVPAGKAAEELLQAEWYHAGYILQRVKTRSISDSALRSMLYRVAASPLAALPWKKKYHNLILFRDMAEYFFTAYVGFPLGSDGCTYYPDVYIVYREKLKTSKDNLRKILKSGTIQKYYSTVCEESKIFSIDFALWWGMTETQVNAIQASNNSLKALNYFLCHPERPDILCKESLGCIYSGKYIKMYPGCDACEGELVDAPEWILKHKGETHEKG